MRARFCNGLRSIRTAVPAAAMVVTSERTPLLECLSLPRFVVVVESVVLRDPAVYLDAPSLLLSKKSADESPSDLKRVGGVHQPAENLPWSTSSYGVAMPQTPSRRERGRQGKARPGDARRGRREERLEHAFALSNVSIFADEVTGRGTSSHHCLRLYNSCGLT